MNYFELTCCGSGRNKQTNELLIKCLTRARTEGFLSERPDLSMLIDVFNGSNTTVASESRTTLGSPFNVQVHGYARAESYQAPSGGFKWRPGKQNCRLC
jgi:hypothetical protein